MRLVVFDLDGTLLTGDTDEYWLRFLIDRGLVDHGEIEQRNQDIQARYVQGLASAEEFCFFYLSLLSARARADLDRLHAEFMREIIIPHLPLAALDLLRTERPRADLLVMSTATNAFLAAPIARHLGFAHLIATDPEEGADGMFTGGCVGLPNMRAHKVTRLEAWLAARGQRLKDFAETWFYSDSRNDLPLLSRVTHPVVVDPDPELAAHALARGWTVLHIHPSAAQAGQPPAVATVATTQAN
ncbi:MAG: HAD family hydrolase [Betaproteobacteria bacterium]|nr:HAD family hydrolase [Betaproteobacteria bacterium]